VNRIHLVVALLAATAGCKRAGGGADSMALVPKESTIVFNVNIDRLRGSKTWAQIKDAANDPSTKKDYDEFVQKTGLDPLTQINGLSGGFLSAAGGNKGQFAVIVRGKFDEQKIIAYAKDKAKEEGKAGDLKTEQYNGKTVYGETDDAGVTFIDSSTLVIGGREWVHKVIDVAAGKGESVKKNDALQGLMGKAHTDNVMWGVGTVPTGEGQLPTGGEFKAVAISIDLQEGLKGEINGQATSPDDAKKMAADLKTKLAESKKDPQVSMALAMSGMGSLLDSIKIDADGTWVKMTASMTQPQLDELVNRVKGMMQMMKGMGGMGGMPGPGGMAPPPGGMPELPPPQPLAPPEAPKKSKKK
jgi:hypothetical protein